MKRARLLSVLLVAVLVPPLHLVAQRWSDLFNPGNAQTLWIQGWVVDAGTQLPLYPAMLTLSSFTGGLVQQISTGSDGMFVFANLGRGSYTLTVTMPGYEMATESISLSDTPESVRIMLRAVPKNAEANPRAGLLSAKDQQVPPAARREYEKGMEKFRKGDARGSLAHFERALQLYPDFAAASALLGLAHLSLGEAEAAEKALLEAVRLDDKLAEPQLALGTLYNSQQRWGEARDLLRRGLALRPGSGRGQFELARACYNVKELDCAFASATHSRELLPRFALAHLLLGYICIGRDDGEGAVHAFEEYLLLVPENPAAPEVRKLIEDIRALLTPASSRP